MNKLFTLLTGMGMGAGFMYFYDPSRGNRRRALVRDQVNSTISQVNDGWNAAVEDLSNRSQGMAYEVRSKLERQPADGDDTNGTLSPSSRLMMIAGGGLLTLYGRGRKGLIGMGLSMAGMSLLARGVANMDFRRMLGLGNDRDAINIQKTINIQGTPEELYMFWSNYTNFPKFMQHVKQVTDLGSRRSHWVVEGPAGANVEWDAITTDQVPNEYIAWHSIDDSPVKNEGSVRFQPNNRGGTRLTVRLGYTPPAGVIGHAVATIFGTNPKQEMDEDLQRLQTLFEEGKTKVKGRLVTGRDLSEAAS